MNDPSGIDQESVRARRREWLRYLRVFAILLALLLVALALVAGIGERQDRQALDAPQAFTREITEITTDPAPWGRYWPDQFDDWKASAGDDSLGGSSALPQSKLEADPWLKRLYAGHAFSIDDREARGHAYMLHDQEVTERVTNKPQPGACLHCHASVSVLYRRVGMEALGEEVTPATLAAEFHQSAVMRGFKELGRKPYREVLALLRATPDGTLGDGTLGDGTLGDGALGDDRPVPVPAAADGSRDEPTPESRHGGGEAHPVACIDCHDPKTLAVRVTRPAFFTAIAALAAGDAAVPHLPSIQQWRQGTREAPYDPNRLASRQEMRSFVCGQCHSEYACGNPAGLTLPWAGGLRAEDEEAFWEAFRLPDGSAFHDFRHGETGAPSYKVEHPEFELWSQGIHARAGVACADCHMPAREQGAPQVSDHRVTSPLEKLAPACQGCHPVAEPELRDWVATIQTRTRVLTLRAATAMTEMLDAIREAQAAGASDTDLAVALRHQRKATWRLDYISSENSKGFHAPQEAARLLAESIDHSRKAQALALRWRAPETPDTSVLFRRPVRGVTDAPAADGGPPSGKLNETAVSTSGGEPGRD